jgi:hypothetical protein
MNNGFWEGDTDPAKRIQSIKLGGSAPPWGYYTAMLVSDGPAANVSPDPYFHCGFANFGTTPKEFPDIATCMSGSVIFSFYLFAVLTQ